MSLRMTRVNKLEGAVDDEFTFTMDSNNVRLETLSSVKDQLDDDLRFLFQEGDIILAIKTSPTCHVAVKRIHPLTQMDVDELKGETKWKEDSRPRIIQFDSFLASCGLRTNSSANERSSSVENLCKRRL